jgi:H+/Cl- antiporter ClcA
MSKATFNKRVIRIKPTSIAMMQGIFASAVGFIIAVLFSLNKTLAIAESTNSVLKGLSFGIVSGAVAIFVVPLVYFGLGWLVGFVQGFVLNALVEGAGGIEVELENND